MSLAVVAVLTGPPADWLPAGAHGRLDVVEDAGPVRAVLSLPVSSPADVPPLGFTERAWLVEQRPQWDLSADEDRRPGRPVTGVKQLTFVHRAAAIDRAEFARHWSEVHAPLARIHHPALWRYQQNVVLEPLIEGMADDVDGIAELTMRLRLDFAERMYDSDEGRRTVGADVRTFIDLRSSWQVVTREHAV